MVTTEIRLIIFFATDFLFITDSVSLLVSPNFLFLSDAVLSGCMFLRINLFLLGCPLFDLQLFIVQSIFFLLFRLDSFYCSVSRFTIFFPSVVYILLLSPCSEFSFKLL